MKKLFPLFCLSLLLSTFANAQEVLIDEQKAELPVFGTIKIRQAGYTGYNVDIEYWIHDKNGKLVYNAQHGISQSVPPKWIFMYADPIYIAAMTKNGIAIQERKRKPVAPAETTKQAEVH